MDVVRLMGYEERYYSDRNTGEQKYYCALHVVYAEEGDGSDERPWVGCKVEELSCPKGVNPHSLQVGAMYTLNYQMFNTRNGKMARVSGLTLLKASVPAREGAGVK